jgi:hypothetical protein
MADGDGLSKYTSHLSHTNIGASSTNYTAHSLQLVYRQFFKAPLRTGGWKGISSYFYLLPSPINKEPKRELEKEAG